MDVTYCYFICIGQQKVGAVRVVEQKEHGRNRRITRRERTDGK